MNLADAWQGATDTRQFDEVKGLIGGPDALVVLLVAGGAMVGALFSADAWNYVTFTAGETKNPHRNLPLSLLFGTGLVITLYLLANIAYLSALPLRGDAKLAEELKAQAKAAETPEAKDAVEKRYQESVGKLGIDH